MPKPKHENTKTWDCPYCGDVYWIKQGDEVPVCMSEKCKPRGGTKLVLRPEDTKAHVPKWVEEPLEE